MINLWYIAVCGLADLEYDFGSIYSRTCGNAARLGCRRHPLTLGANLIDVMPVFEKLPKFLHWWRPKGDRQFNYTLSVYKILWYVRSPALLIVRDQLVREVEEGTAQDCFASHLYENRKEYGLDDTEAMFAGNPPLVCASTHSKFSMSLKEGQIHQGRP
jgi:hypothetical protein